MVMGRIGDGGGECENGETTAEEGEEANRVRFVCPNLEHLPLL